MKAGGRSRMTDIWVLGGFQTDFELNYRNARANPNAQTREWSVTPEGFMPDDLERDGALPLNPSGGLIGGGHPVGATGVRMLVDAAKAAS